MKYLIASFLVACSAHATTYYIDYSGGSDSNSGTSPDAAWRRHPYMVGWGGRYSHVGGDQFIFKGGVTWPNSCFQLHITSGGASDALRDYYGVDPNWFAGAEWARPVFDFEDKLIGFGWNTSAGIWVDGVNYITIDGLELKRHRAPIVPAGSDWGASNINLFRSAAYITIQNCYIHDWSIPTPGPGQDGGGGGGVSQIYGSGKEVIVTRCTFHQANSAVRSGCAVHLGGEVSFCEIFQTSNAFLGSGSIHDNHIHDITGATDPFAHENAIYTHAPSSIYNNRVHHLESSASAIYVSPSFYGGVGYDAIYNNTVYAVGYQAPVQIDMEGAYPNQTGARIYNNVLEHGNGFCVRVVIRGSAVLGLLDVQNNQLITSSPTPLCYNYPAAGCAYVSTIVIKNNSVALPGQAIPETPNVPTTPVPVPEEPPTTPTPDPVPTTPAPDSPLLNGSFENGYTSWLYSGHQRTVVGGRATDGMTYVQFNFGQLAPDAILTQTFPTTPGRQYVLTFDLGAFSLVNRNEQRMLVQLEGASQLVNQTKSVYAPGNGTSWFPQRVVFVADSASTVLTLQDVSPTTENVDLRLDNVKVTGQ